MSPSGLARRATAGIGAALIGAIAPSIAAAPAAEAAPLPLRIDFAPQGTTPPAGWTLDYGQAYDDTRDFGWVYPGTSTPLSIVGNAVARDYPANPRLATLMHMQGDDVLIPGGVAAEGAWEAEVANNAVYTVTVAVGDIQHIDSRHWVTIEGQGGVVDYVPTGIENWNTTVTRTVRVTDGRLTLDARGGTNTKILSVEITAGAPGGRAFIDLPSVTHQATDVFRKSALHVNADRTLDGTTVTPSTVRLTTMAGAAVPASLIHSGSKVTIRPTSDLAARTAYRLTVNGVQASDDTIVMPFESVFTTGTIVGAVPAAGSADIEVTPGSVVVDDVASGATEPAGTVVVRNVGGATLTVNPSLTGAGAGDWRHRNTPISVGPGVAATIPVEFAPTNPGPNVSASLVLSTNDPDEGSVNVPLRGLGTAGTYGDLEPSTQWILDTLGYPVDVGDPNPADGALPGTGGLLGQEVAARAFRAAAPGSPVTLEAVAAFGPEHVEPVMRVGWYPIGSPASINALFSVSAAEAQELLPAAVGTTSLTPGGTAFGFVVTSPFDGDSPVYTQDSLNVWESDPGSPHNIRAYPLRQAGGAIVPNAYVFAAEGFAWGDDFQDIVFIARNVQIVSELGEVGVQPAEMVMSATLGTSSPPRTATVSNSGAMPLAVGSIELTGVDASSFSVSGKPPLPATIAPGASLNVSVVFSPTGNAGSRHAALRILSDDHDEASVDVGLHGLATAGGGGGGGSEPPLAQVVDVLGHQINVGGHQLNLPTSPGPIGDDIDGTLLERASPGPVTVSAVARYAAANAVSFGWYPAGSSTLTTVASIAATANQTLNPATTPAGPASFDPGGRFGLFASRGGAVAYSEDARNAGAGHRMRVYPLRDRAGNRVANSYLVAIDNDDDNGDYQDVVLRIDNVRVNDYTAPPAPSGLVAVAQANDIALDWADVSAPDLAGYRVYRDGHLITTTSLTSSSFADGAAALGTVYSYGVSSVDSWGNESSQTVVFAARPPTSVNPGGSGGVSCDGSDPWAVGMAPVGPTTFHPVTPGRILDTRDGTGAPAGKLSGGCTLALDVTGLRGIPADGVKAVSLNVTATEASENGYVTVYPCAAGRPDTSSLNTRPGRDIANLVTVPVGPDGLVCFYTYRPVHLLADVAGWFGDGDGGSRMTGLAPARVLDTRDGTGAPAGPVAAGGVVAVQVTGWGGVPSSGVSAIVLNLTATESTGPGYLSAYPCDQDVYASALNYVAGQTVANHVLVPLDGAGRFCISSYAESDVVADVLGYYGAPGGVEGSRFTPLTPSRIVDTRSDLPAGATRVGAASVLPVDLLGQRGVPGSGVAAVMFNLTSADAAGPGYLTAFPCGGAPPNASNVNHTASAAASNLVTVPLGTDGQVCIFSYADSDVLVDVAGYFSP